MTRLLLAVSLAVSTLAPAPASAAPSPLAVIEAAQDTKAAAPKTTVNVNAGTAAQFEALPGIGPTTARRIVEYREKNGSFKKLEELMNVQGIGEKSFLKLRPYLTLGAAGDGKPAQ